MPSFLIDDREERRRRGFVREPEQVDPAIAIGEPIGLPAADFVLASSPGARAGGGFDLATSAPLQLDRLHVADQADRLADRAGGLPIRDPFGGGLAAPEAAAFLTSPASPLNLPEAVPAAARPGLERQVGRLEVERRAQPGVLERLFAASGRLDRAYLDAAQDPMTKKLKSLQVLTEAIDKLGDQPEALAIFGPVLREFGRTLDLDLDDDTLKAFAGVKGAAPAVATLAQIDPNLAEEFVTAYERTKDVKVRQSLVETYQKRSLALAQERGVPQLRRFLADPEDRGRLVNAQGQIPEAALLAELDRPEHQLAPFEKQALADYIQSDKGRAELSQLGVAPATITFEAAKAAEIERAKRRETPEKAMDFGDTLESIAQAQHGRPFAALTQPQQGAVRKLARAEKREDTAQSMALAADLREEVAVGRENRKLAAEAQQDIQSLEELMTFVERLDDLTDKVNFFDGPGARIPQAAMAKWQQLMQTDPNFVALNAAGRRLTEFAREIGQERGMISDKDIGRWEKGLPDGTFTRTGAKSGIKEIRTDVVDKAVALQRRLKRQGLDVEIPPRLLSADRAPGLSTATREQVRETARKLRQAGKTRAEVEASATYRALAPEQRRLLLEELD